MPTCARRRLAVAAPVLAMLGCGGNAFACEDSSECGGSGVCELDGYCSFPDEACESGQRYGAHAPDGIAGRCVDPVSGTSTQAVADTGSSTETGSSESITMLESADESGIAESSTSMPLGTTGSLDDSSSSTGTDAVMIGPLLVDDDLDDGAMWPTQWLPSGERPGLGFLGEYTGSAPYYGYMRFRLPQALPEGTTIDSATLELFGHATYYWDSSVDALQIRVEDSADAAVVTSVDAYPGPMGVTLGSASVRWPADGGLTWDIPGPNATPDLAALIQALVDDHGGLASDTHVQLWVGIDVIDGAGEEVGWLDSSAGEATAPRLTLMIH